MRSVNLESLDWENFYVIKSWLLFPHKWVDDLAFKKKDLAFSQPLINVSFLLKFRHIYNSIFRWCECGYVDVEVRSIILRNHPPGVLSLRQSLCISAWP